MLLQSKNKAKKLIIAGLLLITSSLATAASKPEVIKLITENFIAIQVDANARPDLGERYSDWAWPATIFLESVS